MSQRMLLPLVASIALALAACGGGGGGGGDNTAAAGGPTAPLSGGGTAPASGSGSGAVGGGSGSASGSGSPVLNPPVTSTFAAFGPVTVASNAGPQAPVAARLAGGGSVVVWQSWGGALLAQRVDANGVLVGSPIQVASAGSGTVRPAVVAQAGGGFVVAWADLPSAGGTTVVLVRRFDAAGTATSAATPASTGLRSVTGLEAVALPGGGFAVAWSGTPIVGAAARVALLRFDANGAPAAQTQPAEATEAQLQPQLALLGDGTLVLAWLQAGPASATPTFTIHLQRFAANGSALGTARVLANTANAATFQFDLAGLSNGTMALVWQSFGATQGTANLNLQLLAADGSAAAAATQLAASGTTVFDPHVASLGPDGFVVTWQQESVSNIRQTDSLVFAQRFANDGVASGQPQQVASYGLQTTTGQATGQSSLAGGADGHFLLAYDRWLAGSFIDLLGR